MEPSHGLVSGELAEAPDLACESVEVRSDPPHEHGAERPLGRCWMSQRGVAPDRAEPVMGALQRQFTLNAGVLLHAREAPPGFGEVGEERSEGTAVVPDRGRDLALRKSQGHHHRLKRFVVGPGLSTKGEVPPTFTVEHDLVHLSIMQQGRSASDVVAKPSPVGRCPCLPFSSAVSVGDWLRSTCSFPEGLPVRPLVLAELVVDDLIGRSVKDRRR